MQTHWQGVKKPIWYLYVLSCLFLLIDCVGWTGTKWHFCTPSVLPRTRVCLVAYFLFQYIPILAGRSLIFQLVSLLLGEYSVLHCITSLCDSSNQGVLIGSIKWKIYAWMPFNKICNHLCGWFKLFKSDF